MLNDLKFAFRMLAKNPGFTLVATCSLAIGIGANSAIFSFADALLLRPLPVPHPSGIYTVAFGPQSSGNAGLSYPDYRDLRDRNRSFTGLIAYQYQRFAYAPDANTVPDTQFGAFVSSNFFHVLGVQPALGRAFRGDEDRVAGKDPVALLSHSLWMTRYNGDPSVIGRKIRLNGMEFTVIGIAPASFKNMDQFLRPALYVPIAMSPSFFGSNNLEKRDERWLTVKGRLRAGVTAAAAQSDVNAIAQALQHAYANEPRGQKLSVESEIAVRAEQSPADAALVEMLALLAFCVLLVACANVAGLLLSRAAVRGREIAVRLAVGAARWQLLRQLFLENLLLAGAGGLLGIAIAEAGMKLFASIPIPSDLPVSFDIGLDRRVLFFTIVASVASALLFGLFPAWRSSRAGVIGALRARGGNSSRLGKLWGRNVLVAGQMAVSCVLLMLAVLIFMGFHNRLLQGPGFATERLFLMSFDSQLVHDTSVQNGQFYKQLLDGARATAGVQSAALASIIPFGFDNDSKNVIPEGKSLARGEQPASVLDAVVSGGYFEAMHIPIVRGRGFRATDNKNSTLVAVVNERFAEHFWPHQDALGKRFHVDSTGGPLVQVIGVAKNAKYVWISEPPTEFFYRPFLQNEGSAMTLLAKSYTNEPAALAPQLRALVHRIDPRMPVFDVRTMQDLYRGRSVETPEVITKAVAGMGLMALLLAAIGLYGLIAYSVDRRRHEIGVRMAIGADPRGVLRMTLRQALILAGTGLLVGLALGIAASRLVRASFLFAGGNVNPLLFASVLLALVLVSLLAAYAPARRASRIDPIRVLREE